MLEAVVVVVAKEVAEEVNSIRGHGAPNLTTLPGQQPNVH